MPFGLHPAYLIILLAIVLIIFGPGKLPELGGAVGRGIREFRKASNEVADEVKSQINQTETTSTTGTTTAGTANSASAEAEKKS